METNTKPRGWHATGGKPPCTGRGSATVHPFRERKDINAIKGVLANNPRDYALFVVGIHVGLRASDLLNLRWKDVATHDGTILVRTEVIESKTGKPRALVLQPRAREALKLLRAVVREPLSEGYVFRGAHGGRLTVQRLHQLVNEWASAAGVAGNFGTHSLRKTYGCQLRALGIGIEVLMKLFGHSSQSTTLRYIGLRDAEVDAANLKLAL